nr:I78 family peptidase inhibitor [Variovorax sp. dw_308]
MRTAIWMAIAPRLVRGTFGLCHVAQRGTPPVGRPGATMQAIDKWQNGETMNWLERTQFTCGLLLGVATVAGCQMRGDVRPLSSELPPPPNFAGTMPQECRATEARFALGKPIDASTLEEMRLRAGARSARSVRPTDPPPRDVDATRLNVDIEASGRIVGARCG